MYYKTKPVLPVVIEATKLTAQLHAGDRVGFPGDWLIVNIEGKIEFMTEADFQSTYEAADEDEYPTRFKDMPKKERKPRKRKNGIAPEAKTQLEKDLKHLANRATPSPQDLQEAAK